MDLKKAFREKNKNVIMASSPGATLPASSAEKTPLFTFDGGNEISLDEANHNLLILGGTGRGKTSTFVAPMIWNLMEQGLGGLVIDVKNTFSDSVYAMAESCGRFQDVFEIGTNGSAEPVNFLAGLSREMRNETLNNLILSDIYQSKNLDWIYKGIDIVRDCADVLCFLEELRPNDGITLSLAMLSKTISDVEFAEKIWSYFLNTMDKSDTRQVQFKQRVKSNTFHLLGNKSKRKSSRQISEWEMQTTWMLANPRKALSSFEQGNIADKMSAHNGRPLDLDKLIFQKKKIVLLRFSPKSSAAGNLLASSVKEKFYAAAYTRFEDHPEKSDHVFSIMDEFQDIVSYDQRSNFDDFGWFSKAREFKIINVVATQSMSSLYRPGWEHRVRAMLSNFGIKIILQTDDPATDDWVKNFFEAPKPVQKLGSGEALLIIFRLPDRQLEVTLEQAQDVHDRLSGLLRNLKSRGRPVSHRKQGANPVDRIAAKPEWAWQSPVMADIYARFPEAFMSSSDIKVEGPNENLKWIIQKCAYVAEKMQVRIKKFFIRKGTLHIQFDQNNKRTEGITRMCVKLWEKQFELSPFDWAEKEKNIFS